MNILGIHYGHNATVCLMQDGRVTFCQSEERLNRIKNSLGFPSLTLERVYADWVSPDKVDLAVLFQTSTSGHRTLKRNGYRPVPGGFYLDEGYLRTGWKERFYQTDVGWEYKQLRNALKDKLRSKHAEMMAYFSQATRIPESKLRCLDHHLAHAYSAVPNVREWGKALIFTLDAEGDGHCATVNLLQGDRMEVLSQSDNRHSLGYYYTYTTALMGMKGSEHEFKVMGMAPYAKRPYYEKILKRLEGMIHITEAGNWRSRSWFASLIRDLEKVYRFQRFDNISGAIQELTESLTQQWVRHWIQKTGCHDIALAGGVFMNVKACQKIAAMPEVNRIFVVPSAADETTALGCVVWGHLQAAPAIALQPLKDLYLGEEYPDSAIEKALEEMKAASRYEITRPANINRAVAELLARNQIVARCSGRMEFGARALGNRSILANASDFRNIQCINDAIKSRDFWMPFTPSILEEDLPRYIQRPEKLFAPYMCITFDSTEEARRHLTAAVHPKDLTVRPQCVRQSWNPDYHEILTHYKALTGMGGFLNTSFNLHGEPNVATPQDAIRTVDHSGLEHLAMGSYLLKKLPVR
jgi:carbamoyltransferase